jgi:hypothetical protein
MVRALFRTRDASGSNLDSRDWPSYQIFVVYVSPSRQVLRYYLTLGYGSFLPHLFQFLFQYDHPTLCTFGY